MIVVTGATGNVGGELVRALVAAGGPVRAVSRAGTAVTGAEAVAGDLNEPASLAPALAGADGLFLLSGYPHLPDLLASAKDAGVRRVALLSGGSADGGDPANAVAAYMMESEAAVRESGLDWTFLRPMTFMSNTLQWVPQLRDGDVVRAAFPDVATATVDPADIAAVAAVALLTGEHAGQAYKVTGPEALRPADRVAILGAVLGRDLTFEGLSNEEARAEMSAAMPAEYVDAFFAFFVDGTLDESPVHSTVRDVTGRPPRTFREWAVAHADAFKVV